MSKSVSISWLRRRWMEFRWGHSIYLTFPLSAVNFILITYRLFIEEVPFLRTLFPHLQIFIGGFIVVYPPIAIAVGRWHRKTQLGTEAVMVAKENPITMEIFERVQRIEKMLQTQRRRQQW